jgi:toxin ParE1/3/4
LTATLHRLDFSFAARIDLASILDHSAEIFGVSARIRYEAIIKLAMSDLQADPVCVGSLRRPELGPGIHTYHLRHCRRRGRAKGASVSRPRHLVAYKFDHAQVLIVRILHDTMDLARHLPPEP